jgi:hypothetical protein
MFSANEKLIAFTILFLSFGISYIPDSLNDVGRWLAYLGYSELGVAFFLPVGLIVLLLAQRKRGVSY